MAGVSLARGVSATDVIDFSTMTITGQLPVANGGTASATTLAAKSGLNLPIVNVKDYGAVGNGVTDDLAAINSAISALGASGGVVMFGPGNYAISATISLPAEVWLKGTNRNTCKILAITGLTYPIVTLAGEQARIESLFLFGGSVGVSSSTGLANACAVYNCRISGNRIGLLLDNAFINDIACNHITFNSYGVVVGNQAYQLLIRENVIDNNLGGAGIVSYGGNGCVIENNTIEGNRNTGSSPSNGVGLALNGLAQRVVINNNWFESNGTSANCTDILIGRPDQAWVSTLVSNCIPTEYQSYFEVGDVVTGGIYIDKNFFLATQRAITIGSTNSTNGHIKIGPNTFVGELNKYNIPVQLYNSTSSYPIVIDKQSIVNTSNSAVTAQMILGIQSTPIYYSGTVPAYGAVMYDGKDLFTANLTLKQFAALTGATLDGSCRRPSSGNATLYNGKVKAVGGTNGCRVVTGSSRPRAGASQFFASAGAKYYVCVLGSKSASWDYDAVQKNCTDANGFLTITLTGTITDVEATYYNGDYVGYFVMTEAQFAASSINGATRMIIQDLDFVENVLFSATDPSTYTSASSYVWAQGDIVYNTAPAAAGNIGWVCVTGGTPGTWKTFGTIAA